MEETGLKEGDMLEVKLIGSDPKTGKLKLSTLQLCYNTLNWLAMLFWTIFTKGELNGTF